MNRRPEDIRSEIDRERTELAQSVEALRTAFKQATDVKTKLRENLPVAAGVALGAGFVLSGGIGATMRLLFRRGREGSTKARFGRFVVVDRD
jgi:4-diphosphocytidyl-2C-methyl-D-erythritol kinase